MAAATAGDDYDAHVAAETSLHLVTIATIIQWATLSFGLDRI